MYEKKIKKLANGCREYDPFYQETNSNKYIEWIKNEIYEMEEEIKKWNNNELEKEIGDIYWNFLMIINKLQDEWKIEEKNVYKKLYQKMKKRKAHVVWKKKVSYDEAIKIWNNAKRNEWYSDDRLWKG